MNRFVVTLDGVFEGSLHINGEDENHARKGAMKVLGLDAEFEEHLVVKLLEGGGGQIIKINDLMIGREDCGPLLINHEGDKYFWGFASDFSDLPNISWNQIPKSLYDELLKHERAVSFSNSQSPVPRKPSDLDQS